ncbi:hypothetical protein BH20ACT24_BH20ACT24_00110 [soil metagenome]
MGSVTDIDLTQLYDETKSLAEGAITIPGYTADGWSVRIWGRRFHARSTLTEPAPRGLRRHLTEALADTVRRVELVLLATPIMHIM